MTLFDEIKKTPAGDGNDTKMNVEAILTCDEIKKTPAGDGNQLAINHISNFLLDEIKKTPAGDGNDFVNCSLFCKRVMK